MNVETVRSLHLLSDEYDDLTASIYVLVQVKQITHCLNVLSSQVEPDAEDDSYQFSVKIIGVPEISSNETAPETSSFCVKLFQEMGAEVSIFDIDTMHCVSTRGYVTLFTIFLKSSQVSSQQLHPGGEGGGSPGEGMPPGSPNPDPISTKKCNFLSPFSDQTSKIQTIFQTWPLGGNYVIIS